MLYRLFLSKLDTRPFGQQQMARAIPQTEGIRYEQWFSGERGNWVKGVLLLLAYTHRASVVNQDWQGHRRGHPR